MVISCGSEAFHLGSDLSFIPQEVSSTACKDEWTADVSLTSLKGGKSGGDSLYSFLGSFEAYKLAVYIITWPTNQRVFIVLPSILGQSETDSGRSKAPKVIDKAS